MRKAIARLQVTAMAYERQYAKNKIQELAYQVYVHSFKIMLFPEASYVKGWEKEIRAWYGAMLNFSEKIKGKPLTQLQLRSLLLDNLHGANSIRSAIFLAKDANEELKPREVTEGTAHQKMNKFYQGLVVALGKGKTPEDIDSLFQVLKE